MRDGTATIYATHDASEALAVAERVLVLRGGRVVQVGSPIEIYEQPVDRWAAEMTGPASVLETDVVATSPGRARLSLGGVERAVDCSGADTGVPLIRPEWAEKPLDEQLLAEVQGILRPIHNWFYIEGLPENNDEPWSEG